MSNVAAKDDKTEGNRLKWLEKYLMIANKLYR